MHFEEVDARIMGQVFFERKLRMSEEVLRELSKRVDRFVFDYHE